MKKRSMTRRNKGMRYTVLFVLGLAVIGTLYWFGRSNEAARVNSNAAGQPAKEARTEGTTKVATQARIPPYYESAEAARPFPRLLPAAYFRRSPVVAAAYRIAGEIPGVVAQQPCYCFCDKYGHHSLLDCYASDHGAG